MKKPVAKGTESTCDDDSDLNLFNEVDSIKHGACKGIKRSIYNHMLENIASEESEIDISYKRVYENANNNTESDNSDNLLREEGRNDEDNNDYNGAKKVTT